MHRIGRCRASRIGDGSWGIVSRMSGLMFIRRGSSWRLRRAVCVARCGNMAGSRTRRRLAGKLGQEGLGLRFCYKAGPCGYRIQRQLSAHGPECIVVAPSLIPKRTGDRVKTDRRNGATLAKLHRAGELTAVWVPDPGQEAMRDLGACPSRCGAGAAPGAPAALGVSLAPGLPLWASGMDQAAPPLACGSALRPGSARLTAQTAAMLPDWELAPVGGGAAERCAAWLWSMQQH